MPELVFPEPVAPVISQPRQNCPRIHVKPPRNATRLLRFRPLSNIQTATKASTMPPAKRRFRGLCNDDIQSRETLIGLNGTKSSFITKFSAFQVHFVSD